MEEPAVRPSVFVVDGQTDVPFRRLEASGRKAWCSATCLSLGLLLGLLVAGLVVQGYFLLQLYWRVGEMASPLSDQETGSEEKWLHERNTMDYKPVAHLIGTNFSLQNDKSPLLWDTNQGMAFMRGFYYKAGSLIVRRTGYYYIYSQVQLANRGCPKAGYSFSHGIYLRSSTYPEVELGLLKGRNTPCEVLDSRQELWFDTSSLGGLVFLQAKDEVLVRLLDISIIRVRGEMQSYFGAFMV